MTLVCSVSYPSLMFIPPCCPKPLVREEGGTIPWAFVDSFTLPRGESAFEREGEGVYS